MKKKLAVILCFVIVVALALTGCGGEKSKFIGMWEAKIDMVDYIYEGLNENKDMAEHIDIDNFDIVFIMEFDKDGTYKQYLDEDALEDTLDDVKKEFKDGMLDYFEDYLDELEIDMTVEELLESSDTDLDTLMDESFGDKFIESMAEELKGEGNYVVKDGKLFLSDGLDTTIEKDKYQTYEFDGKDLKILEEVGFEEEDDENLDNLYPLTFKKIG